jgi:hypothetical protein
MESSKVPQKIMDGRPEGKKYGETEAKMAGCCCIAKEEFISSLFI